MSATSRPRADRKRTTVRQEVHVTPVVNETIQSAMAISGLSLGDLASVGARRILDDHERIRLTKADRELFLCALANPPPPTPQLIGAVLRRRAEFGG